MATGHFIRGLYRVVISPTLTTVLPLANDCHQLVPWRSLASRHLNNNLTVFKTHLLIKNAKESFSPRFYIVYDYFVKVNSEYICGRLQWFGPDWTLEFCKLPYCQSLYSPMGRYILSNYQRLLF